MSLAEVENLEYPERVYDLDIFHLDAVVLLYECHDATQRYMLPLHHIAPKRGKNKKEHGVGGCTRLQHPWFKSRGGRCKSNSFIKTQS